MVRLHGVFISTVSLTHTLKSAHPHTQKMFDVKLSQCMLCDWLKMRQVYLLSFWDYLNFSLVEAVLGDQHHISHASDELLFSVVGSKTFLDHRNDFLARSASDKHNKLEAILLLVFLVEWHEYTTAILNPRFYSLLTSFKRAKVALISSSSLDKAFWRSL